MRRSAAGKQPVTAFLIKTASQIGAIQENMTIRRLAVHRQGFQPQRVEFVGQLLAVKGLMNGVTRLRMGQAEFKHFGSG